MRRGAGVLCLTAAVTVSVAACPQRDPPAAPTGRGLRVPLRHGWVANVVGDRLEAGPPQRVVVSLESKSAPLPPADSLAAAAEASGARRLLKESDSLFVLVRYALGADAAERQAFLSVRQVGVRTVWCASAPSAREEDLAEAIRLCRSVTAD